MPTLWCRFRSPFGSFVPALVARGAAVCADSSARGSTGVSVIVAGGALSSDSSIRASRSSDSSIRASRYWFQVRGFKVSTESSIGILKRPRNIVMKELSYVTNFITSRKRTFGQGIVFTPVCYSLHRGMADTPGRQTPLARQPPLADTPTSCKIHLSLYCQFWDM